MQCDSQWARTHLSPVVKKRWGTQGDAKDKFRVLYRVILVLLLWMGTAYTLKCDVVRVFRGISGQSVNETLVLCAVWCYCGTDLCTQKSRCTVVRLDTLQWEQVRPCLVRTLCEAGPVCNRIIQRKRRPNRSTVACFPVPHSKTVLATALFGWSHYHSWQCLKHTQKYDYLSLCITVGSPTT
jgi:hypothetical protein